MKILFNHVGYTPLSEKRILLEAPAATRWRRVSIISIHDGAEVLVLEPRFSGGVAGWSVGPWWEVDASALTTPGRYAVSWMHEEGQGQSEGFTVAADALGHPVISDILFYFKGQRCSGIYDQADRKAKRVGDAHTFDVHGGWYDASGDTSKYLSHLSYANHLNPQQTPLVVWVLARTWRLYRDAGAHPYFLERLRDEALHGADWLVRMQAPEGFWHVTLFDRWSKDPAQRELCSYRTQRGEKFSDFQAGWRQGGGMASAALAAAAALGDGEYPASRYVESAERGFLHLLDQGLAYLDDGEENIIDDACALLAAVELAPLCRSTPIATAVNQRIQSLVSRRRLNADGLVWLAADATGDRSWVHASDAGLPLLALREAADHLPAVSPEGMAAASLARQLLEAQVSLARAPGNPFAYPPHWYKAPGIAGHVQWFYPHQNPSGYWWQGENARLASLAAAAERLSSEGAPTLATSRRWVDWIFGANPFDVCMMHGRGRNNPVYERHYHNAPGGVANGITSGFDDEADIAFAPLPQADDPAQKWRWGEQWLPHAAWLLYALALRETKRAP